MHFETLLHFHNLIALSCFGEVLICIILLLIGIEMGCLDKPTDRTRQGASAFREGDEFERMLQKAKVHAEYKSLYHEYAMRRRWVALLTQNKSDRDEAIHKRDEARQACLAYRRDHQLEEDFLCKLEGKIDKKVEKLIQLK